MNDVLTINENVKNFSPNYLATICKIETITPIENSDRLVKTSINGYDLVISNTCKEGDLMVYFPAETQIFENYLSSNNLYEMSLFEKNSNADIVKTLLEKSEDATDDEKININNEIKTLCGFFKKNGRVRILKLRGEYSQGFLAPVDTLENLDKNLKHTNWESYVGVQFNHVLGKQICTKYVPKQEKKVVNSNIGQSRWRKIMKRLKKYTEIIEGQFIFHYNTTMLGDTIRYMKPTDDVSITVKLHGTSIIMSNILCKSNLSFYQKIKKFFGFNVKTTEYKNIFSSRKVILNDRDMTNDNKIYFEVNKVFSPYISEGMTIYGEVVGYYPYSEKMIQTDHDYGCDVGCWKFMPYRITMNDEYNDKIEWPLKDVYGWTLELLEKHPDLNDKIIPLQFVYEGQLKDLYPELETDTHWHANLLARMKNDKERFLMEEDEPLCKNKVPREGIVLRLNNDTIPRAYKLKTLRHYMREAELHDKGVVDIEESQS